MAAENPYAAPKTSVSDAAPRLGIGARAARGLAFLGNVFLLLLPLFFLLSHRRPDTGFLVASGDSDWVALFFLAVPAALNLLAILLVRRGRGPSDDTFAMRR